MNFDYVAFARFQALKFHLTLGVAGLSRWIGILLDLVIYNYFLINIIRAFS